MEEVSGCVRSAKVRCGQGTEAVNPVKRSHLDIIDQTSKKLALVNNPRLFSEATDRLARRYKLTDNVVRNVRAGAKEDGRRKWQKVFEARINHSSNVLAMLLDARFYDKSFSARQIGIDYGVSDSSMQEFRRIIVDQKASSTDRYRKIPLTYHTEESKEISDLLRAWR